jgi:hypothetical protein
VGADVSEERIAYIFSVEAEGADDVSETLVPTR